MQLTVTKRQRELGARLRSERERLGYDERQIAQFVGIPPERYARQEAGDEDSSVFAMQRLSEIGFDVLYVITGEHYRQQPEESELLKRFRDLSLRGRNAVFTTLDALERLAPNLRETLRDRIRESLRGGRPPKQ